MIDDKKKMIHARGEKKEEKNGIVEQKMYGLSGGGGKPLWAKFTCQEGETGK